LLGEDVTKYGVTDVRDSDKVFESVSSNVALTVTESDSDDEGEFVLDVESLSLGELDNEGVTTIEEDSVVLWVGEREQDRVGVAEGDIVRDIVCESDNEATNVGVGVGGGVIVAVMVEDGLGDVDDVWVGVCVNDNEKDASDREGIREPVIFFVVVVDNVLYVTVSEGDMDAEGDLVKVVDVLGEPDAVTEGLDESVGDAE
jgi:hypothetical protein